MDEDAHTPMVVKSGSRGDAGTGAPRSALQKAYDFGFATEARTSLSIFAFVTILGVSIGAGFPPDNYKAPYGIISSIVGWVYFSAWSVSFWPQIFLNYQRKSVQGLSFDYLALNVLGFACYTAYNLGYAYNPEIRAAYQKAHNGSLPAVQPNDVFFAVHAVVATLITAGQCVIYERGGQRVSYMASAVLVCLLAAIGVVAALTATAPASSSLSWLNYLLFLSYVKLAISIMKYSPQVVLNCRRRSTQGWTIHNVLLDFAGGALSLAQLIMDCWVSGDWSGIEGDPVKFGLGLASMVYDVIFMVQHYCLFPSSEHEGGKHGAYDAVAEELEGEWSLGGGDVEEFAPAVNSRPGSQPARGKGAR